MTAPARIGALIAVQRRQQAARLRLASTAGAVVAVSAVCLLGLSGWFITGAALAGVGGLLAVQAFNYLMPSAVIRLLAILRTGARYIERVAGHEAALKALARLRPQLFDALASAPPERALALSSGEASARLVQDVDAVQTLFVRLSTPWALGAGALSAAVLTGLAHALAAVVILAAMAVFAAGAALIGARLAAPAGRSVQVETGRFKDRLSALEAVAPELKAYGLETWASRQASDAAARFDEAHLRLAQAGGWIAAWQAVATALAVGLVVLTTAGAPLPLTALAALAAVMGMESAAGLVGALQQRGAAAEATARLDAVLPPPPPHAGRALQDPGLLVPALGEPLLPPFRLAVIGPSGAGKTTLIERLVGLREALPDEARLGGVDLTEIIPADRRRLFAYASQDVRLLDGSVRQNLALAGLADDAKMWDALEIAALAERFRTEPRGLDTPIGPNGEHLSGGERRRLGLARALLRDAPWLVLDEPTEGLDSDTERRVLEGLDRRLRERNQGLILVSHRPAPTRLCERRLQVEGVAPDGRIRITATDTPVAA